MLDSSGQAGSGHVSELELICTLNTKSNKQIFDTQTKDVFQMQEKLVCGKIRLSSCGITPPRPLA